MLTDRRAHEIFDSVRKHSSGDDVEVLIAGGDSALTRFANNTIHQNVSDENYVASIRAVFGQKTARATTNKLDDDSLRRSVKAAEDLARVQQPNPDMLPTATPEEAGMRDPGEPAPSRHFDAPAA